MSIEMKPGRWKQRDLRTAIVQFTQPLAGWPWKGVNADGEADSWRNDGCHLTQNHADDLDLVEYLGPLEGDAASEKHQAACRLLQAAEQMRDLMTKETDGEGVCYLGQLIVLHAKRIESLTRPENASE